MSGAMRPPEPGEPRPSGESQGIPGQGPGQGSEEQAGAGAAGEAAAEESQPEVLEKGTPYDRSRDQTERLIRENRNFVAEYADSFACGLEAMARTLEDEGRRDSASQVHRAAGELGRASKKVREDSLVRLAREMEARARERPMLAFGGAALAGFALSRVLKSRPVGHNSEEE